jgi:hypothetical protein
MIWKNLVIRRYASRDSEQKSDLGNIMMRARSGPGPPITKVKLDVSSCLGKCRASNAVGLRLIGAPWTWVVDPYP